MSRVQAVTRSTAAEIAALRAIAKDLGGTTEFSATQVASGLEYLGRAGFGAANSIAAIPAVLDLATAASMDLGRAADVASNIMSGFGIAAERAGDVADLLAVASSSANTDVSQLGAAMKYVGPVAAQLGISMGDAAAAVGVLSDAGIQGQQAGTALRAILARLVKPTKEAEAAIKGLGLTVADLNPATKSLTEIVDTLAASNMSAAEATTIFGVEALAAILALSAGSEKLTDLTDKYNDVTGAVSEMAGVMRDNIQGDLQSLASAWEAVTIAMGEAGVTNALRSRLQGITGMLRDLAANMDTVAQAASDMWTIITAPTHLVQEVFRTLSEAIQGYLGVDIANAVGSAMPLVLDHMHAAAVAIEDAFSDIPNYFGDLGILAIERFLNNLTQGLRWATELSAMLPEVLGLGKGWTLPEFDFSGYLHGGLQASYNRGLRERRSQLTNEGPPGIGMGGVSQDTSGVTAATDALSTALDRLSTATETATTTGGRYKVTLKDIIQGADEYVAGQKIEAEAMGLTAKAAAALRHEYDLSLQAIQADIALTPDVVRSLRERAEAMAEADMAAEASRKSLDAANDNISEARGAFKGFFSDIISGFREGKSAAEVFGNAIQGLLDRLADRALDRLADLLFPEQDGGTKTQAAPGFLQSVLAGITPAAANSNDVTSVSIGSAAKAATTSLQQVSANAGELAQGIAGAAQRLGIDPVDLATAISYETAGTFDPTKRGPTTQWGQHKGLIQWGEPQAMKYLGGDFSIGSQMDGIVKYLQDAGVRPGMGLMDIYSAINAGSVGRYGASDAGTGGAWGTVADKVNYQMAGHRAKAEQLMAGTIDPAQSQAAQAAAQANQQLAQSAQQAASALQQVGQTAPGAANDNRFDDAFGMFEMNDQGGGAPAAQPLQASVASLQNTAATFPAALDANLNAINAGVGQVGQGFVGQFGGILQSILGSLGGEGGGAGGLLSIIPAVFSLFGGARAAGGPVDAGKAYLVGENGPELRTFGSSGYIHNAAQTRAMMRPSGGAMRPQIIERERVVVVGGQVQQDGRLVALIENVSEPIAKGHADAARRDVPAISRASERESKLRKTRTLRGRAA